jgi:hypothetical protein
MAIVHMRSLKGLVIRALVFGMLVSVAGFSALAKNTQYLPKSNPARYISIAGKMKADSDCIPAPVEPQPARPSSRLEPPAAPVPFVNRLDLWEAPCSRLTRFIACLRHRGPPVASS